MAPAVTFPRCPSCGTVMVERQDKRTHDRPEVAWHECSCGHTTPKVLRAPAPAQPLRTSASRLREAVTC